MDIERISDVLSVSGQVQLTDLARVQELGFRTLIINRPDHEGGPAQPTSAAIKAAADELGLAVTYIPVEMGRIEPSQVAAFGHALDNADTPVLAYCKSGKRARMLWERSRPLPSHHVQADGAFARLARCILSGRILSRGARGTKGQ